MKVHPHTTLNVRILAFVIPAAAAGSWRPRKGTAAFLAKGVATSSSVEPDLTQRGL
jgi:hypothetical protein